MEIAGDEVMLPPRFCHGPHGPNPVRCLSQTGSSKLRGHDTFFVL